MDKAVCGPGSAQKPERAPKRGLLGMPPGVVNEGLPPVGTLTVRIESLSIGKVSGGGGT